ncbi:type II secretion system F family protein [Sinanaerobacter chloroacetimidivorans]|uniref:Type II secretion system F family protein n=1 Tax=Sinanaerobacter chloroacetimidivorans TaxID=2818044 RepID=A0A8J7W344_9FIRM|nr:type II secretion system F family protein [Sinanaerobacter chloroacetimidivorans]MBR0600014.1 type II secretion system F family protein [Sinanaerobacter chloroacetimidivorans]
MMIYLIAVTAGMLIYTLIFIKLSSYGQQKDLIKKRLHSVADHKKNFSLDEELSKPLSERIFKPLFKNILQGIRRFIPEERTANGKAQSSQSIKLKKQLRQAGIKISVNEYHLVRLMVMFGSGAILAMISLSLDLPLFGIFFLGMIGIYAAFVILRFHLARRISYRHSEMQKMLPEVLDMLSVSVEAGLGLEQAMVHVVNHFEGPLIDEIAITNREMSMGRNRKEALLLLGDRCEIEEMKTFVRAIVQAMQLGISIKNVLRSQSALMRQTRRNKIEEKAMQVSVKILLPMAFFIFPVIFIVLLGPAFVKIAVNFL